MVGNSSLATWCGSCWWATISGSNERYCCTGIFTASSTLVSWTDAILARQSVLSVFYSIRRYVYEVLYFSLLLLFLVIFIREYSIHEQSRIYKMEACVDWMMMLRVQSLTLLKKAIYEDKYDPCILFLGLLIGNWKYIRFLINAMLAVLVAILYVKRKHPF